MKAYGFGVAGVVLGLLVLAGCSLPETTTATPVETRAPAVSRSPQKPRHSESAGALARPTTKAPKATRALALLAGLPIKGRAPKTGYARDQFGQAWTDDVSVEGGHNGCDTRNDILQRDLLSITFRDGGDCVVLSGLLHDAYTATTIDFLRGQDTSSAVQIDHVVALSDAWQTGAQQLTAEQRTDLANDPLNLQAVDGPTNQQKSDSDAASWLPPNKAYRCTYVTRQVQVKVKYRLWVTQAEHDAIARVLDHCADVAAESPTPVPVARKSPTPKPTPSAAPAKQDVYYKNCTAVREAGVAPIYRGDPGYASHLDRDGDGVACE